MSGGSFIKRDLLDRDKGIILFRELRLLRIRKEIVKKGEWDWAKTGHKIYPSSLHFGMCPYKFIREDIQKYSDKYDSGLESMDDGSYKHVQIQDEAKQVPGLLWEGPISNIPEEVKHKFKHNAVEVPIYDKEVPMSGMIDLILDVGGVPVIVDIKTVQQSDDKWKNRYPTEKQYCQAAMYFYVTNKLNYFHVKASQFGLVYINLCLPPSDKSREYEVYYDWTPDLEKEVELLLSHLTKERKLFLANESSECSYPKCKTHANKTSD